MCQSVRFQTANTRRSPCSHPSAHLHICIRTISASVSPPSIHTSIYPFHCLFHSFRIFSPLSFPRQLTFSLSLIKLPGFPPFFPSAISPAQATPFLCRMLADSNRGGSGFPYDKHWPKFVLFDFSRFSDYLSFGNSYHHIRDIGPIIV